MQSIRTRLASRKDLSGFQLRKVLKTSHEAHAVNGRLETLRCNTIPEYHLHVLTPGSQAGKIGECRRSFQLFPGETAAMIEEAVTMAGLVENPAYDFSPAWKIPPGENPACDPLLFEDPETLLMAETEKLLALRSDDLAGCHLASFELFFEKNEVQVMNHHGLDIRYPTTRITFDFVVLSPDKENEFNFFGRRRFCSDFACADIIRSEARALADSDRAQLPPTGVFPVVLTEEALDSIFDYFITQSQAGALYYGYAAFEKGAPVLPAEVSGDLLSLTTDPAMKGAMGAGILDDTGFPLKSIDLIGNNKLLDFAVDGKYARLLDMPRTSAFSTVKVAPGTMKADEMKKNGVIELSRFSTFQPNGITGAFSAEIRRGFLHKDGQSIPLKGGSVSGTSREAFRKVRFSRETVQRGNYYGPSALYFEELTIAGE